MRVTILTVPGCPNAALARDRVTAALGKGKADIEYIEVHDADEATARGMAGSPTVLVDGVDVTDPPAAPGFACRITLPSHTRLRAALESRTKPSDDRE